MWASAPPGPAASLPEDTSRRKQLLGASRIATRAGTARQEQAATDSARESFSACPRRGGGKALAETPMAKDGN